MPLPATQPRNRIVLLFDLDCFYAQCERVRLGLDTNVSLALLQWNCVLAVTYPARNLYKIKRGDTWDDISKKSNNECWTIHLPILTIKDDQPTSTKIDHRSDDSDMDNSINGENENVSLTTIEDQEEGEARNDDTSYDLKTKFRKEFNLSPEEQERCRKEENGVRRFHHQGKASLERYRLASARIFQLVLESLRKRLNHPFVLEKASVDEFYLDITDYCYSNISHDNHDDKIDFGSNTTHSSNADQHECEDNDSTQSIRKTVVIGPNQEWLENGSDDHDIIQKALRKACQVSYWIRDDIWSELGFTMSAGISTNKMMAKLATSFGKPNGQAVLHPNHFSNLMAETKVTKVRNFGGKLGKEVLRVIHSYGGWNSDKSMEELNSSPTMADLAQIPLPMLQSKFSNETATFIFQACQGIDHEPVKETSGALVKSITAFKGFPANKDESELLNWLRLLATEITERVAQDTARNHRYPKTCTLNYSYYITPDGKRPSGSSRGYVQSRSIRLQFPSERESFLGKCSSIVNEAMEKLIEITKHQLIRGIGLSASNFESRGQPPDGVPSIQSFFSKATSTDSEKVVITSDNTRTERQQQSEKMLKDGSARIGNKRVHSEMERSASRPIDDRLAADDVEYTKSAACTLTTLNTKHNIGQPPTETVDTDLELAKKLQASFDRENYILSNSRSRKELIGSKKSRKIDAFFSKKSGNK